MNNLSKNTPATTGETSLFNSGASFEHAQRVAKMLSSSDLVPKEYKGNISNTLVAFNMAQRIGADPLAVMQNLHIIHGRPSWSSTFLISAINTSGRFSPLKFKMENLGDKTVKGTKIKNLSCIAYARDPEGDVVEGPRVTIEMSVLEGWYGRSGSKWPTMPELMLRYRAAGFFVRLYAPEIAMGMKTAEETEDIAGTIEAGPAEVVEDLQVLTAKVIENAPAEEDTAPDDGWI